LGKINHYCYRGRRDFRKGFRVLIAGGGTGDALIYLAEQLRETDARLVYLDISEASMAIAKKRAEIRNLDRIEWVSGSILDLPRLGLGPFD
jgi:ubiquinone/menaquinone biosynthesis C-methylase UbiE